MFFIFMLNFSQVWNKNTKEEENSNLKIKEV